MKRETFLEGICPQHSFRTSDEARWREHNALPHKTREQLEWESLTPFGRQLKQNNPLLYRSLHEDWWGPAIIVTGFLIPIVYLLLGGS